MNLAEDSLQTSLKNTDKIFMDAICIPCWRFKVNGHFGPVSKLMDASLKHGMFAEQLNFVKFNCFNYGGYKVNIWAKKCRLKVKSNKPVLSEEATIKQTFKLFIYRHYLDINIFVVLKTNNGQHLL